MATMLELSERYLEEAERLKENIACRSRLLPELLPEEQKAMEHDLRLLRQMLRETREIGNTLRHYYERSLLRRNRKYIC